MPIEADCSNCGDRFSLKPYRLRRSENVFCSTECHNEFQKSDYSINCKNCGEEVDCRPSDEQKFCSKSCSRKYKGNVSVSCNQCGDEFVTHKCRVEMQERVFCSSDCVSNWRRENWEGENNPNYKNGRNNGFGSNWLQVKRQVLDRADGSCEWCNKSSEENGRELSVHHIIPRDEFINHDELSVEDSNFTKNLLALCRSCHMSAEWSKNTMYPNKNYVEA